MRLLAIILPLLSLSAIPALSNQPEHPGPPSGVVPGRPAAAGPGAHCALDGVWTTDAELSLPGGRVTLVQFAQGSDGLYATGQRDQSDGTNAAVVYRRTTSTGWVEDKTFEEVGLSKFGVDLVSDRKGDLWLLIYSRSATLNQAEIWKRSSTGLWSTLPVVSRDHLHPRAMVIKRNMSRDELWVASILVDPPAKAIVTSKFDVTSSTWTNLDPFLSSGATHEAAATNIAVAPDGQIWTLGRFEDDNDVFHAIVLVETAGSFNKIIDYVPPSGDPWASFESVGFTDTEYWISYSEYRDPGTWNVASGIPSASAAGSSFNLKNGFTLVPGHYAQSFAVLCHTSGRVFVGGVAEDAAGTRHGIVTFVNAPEFIVSDDSDDFVPGLSAFLWDLFEDSKGNVWATYSADSKTFIRTLLCR